MGRGRERWRERTPSRVLAISAEPDMGLDLQSQMLNRLSHPGAPHPVLITTHAIVPSFYSHLQMKKFTDEDEEMGPRRGLSDLLNVMMVASERTRVLSSAAQVLFLCLFFLKFIYLFLRETESASGGRGAEREGERKIPKQAPCSKFAEPHVGLEPMKP